MLQFITNDFFRAPRRLRSWRLRRSGRCFKRRSVFASATTHVAPSVCPLKCGSGPLLPCKRGGRGSPLVAPPPRQSYGGPPPHNRSHPWRDNKVRAINRASNGTSGLGWNIRVYDYPLLQTLKAKPRSGFAAHPRRPKGSEGCKETEGLRSKLSKTRRGLRSSGGKQGAACGVGP